MNAQLEITLERSQFLRWVQGRPGRYELKGGRVVMHAGTTRNHWLVYNRFIVEIAKQLDSGRWVVGGTDFAIEVGEKDIRYPDVLVEAAGRDGKALTTSEPILIVEVLSPSSVGTDMTEKPAEYGSLPSLAAYIVASQDEPIAWVWRREAGADGAMPIRPAEVAGRDAIIEVEALGVSIRLDAVYHGIGTF